MKTRNISMLIITGLLMIATSGIGQDKAQLKIAIMNVDAQGMEYDAATIAYILRLEVDKTEVYSVVDKYEMADVFKVGELKTDGCFSRACLVTAGKLLSADKILSGDIARFGEKIIITLRLIDVQTETIERSQAIEYLNMQSELQKMIEISVKRLLNIEPDSLMVNQLVNYDMPVSSPKTMLRLNGPRMGASYTMGETGDRLRAPKEEGGFDMYRATFQFGYQKEFQYLSAGDFQALVEFVGMFGGLENGKFIPSFTMLNGFRWGKKGWEFGFGPSFRFVRKADGFFDKEGVIGSKGEWHLASDWGNANFVDENGESLKNPYTIVSRLDSRGIVRASTGLLIAVGRTYKSGYLNVPFNIWASPRRDGLMLGFSFGFNVNKKPISNS